MDTWKIPMADPAVGEEEARAVYGVVLSGWLSAGPKVPEFEKGFSGTVGVKHAVAFCNGTAALHATLLATGIGRGDEVIVPDITFVSTATSVIHTGATPVFADVDPVTLNIRPESIQQNITSRTRAIVPVHYAGQSADMDRILDMGRSHGLEVIEDAAEAHGAEYKGRRIGSLGRAAIFSFTPNKNITSGEGGMVTTNDDQLADCLRLLRNHGSRVNNEYEMLGYNYRMTEMQAAIGVEQLKKLPPILQRKQELVDCLSAIVKQIPGLEIPTALGGNRHTYQMYTIRIDAGLVGATRDQVRERMTAKGIQTRVCFPPLHLQPLFSRYANPDSRLGNSERLGREILSLPIHTRLTKDQVNYIGKSLASAVHV
ncbi:MAG: DegT/DnrJ/EryC1/StrS family aminotransferase [Candidatus Binatia bacterium]